MSTYTNKKDQKHFGCMENEDSHKLRAESGGRRAVCPFQLPKLLNPLDRKQVVVTAEMFCSLNAINSM